MTTDEQVLVPRTLLNDLRSFLYQTAKANRASERKEAARRVEMLMRRLRSVLEDHEIETVFATAAVEKPGKKTKLKQTEID